MEDFKHMPDLDENVAVGEEMNPAATYPPISTCINHILLNQQQDATEINLDSLAINGRVVQDDMGVYLADKSLSSSSLKEVLKTPLHHYFYVNNTLPKKEGKHFDLGTFAHKAFLEPDLFDKCVVEPKASRAKTEDVIMLIRFYEKLNGQLPAAYLEAQKLPDLKAYLARLEADCTYEIIEEEHKIVIDVLKRNYLTYGGGIIPLLMKGAKAEVSFYGTDPDFDLPVRVRPDAINIAENIGVDAIISFKTTAANELGKFLYDSAKFKYELSEGMYLDVVSNVTGRPFKTVITIMLQTCAPYLPAVFWWDAEDLENGKAKYKHALSVVSECQDKQSWPGFDAQAESGNYGIIEMKQPEWASKLLHPVDVED